MKICQLCAVDFTLYHFLLPLMRGLRAEGHEVVAMCADGALIAQVRADGFRVETVPLVRGYDPRHHWRALRRLIRLFRDEQFDLIHVHTPVAALIGRLAAAATGTPRLAYTAHGFYFHERMASWRRALFIALEWLGGRVTDVLFTQAEEDAATARRYSLCRGAIIEAIGNGADPRKFYPTPRDGTRATMRAALGADDAIPVIAVVARLVAEKGYPELFAAMRHVAAVLWVVGERLPSDHAAAIDSAVAAVERDEVLRARVRFLGYRRDVAEILRAADIFTLPSHREGMPRSIVEAMLTGLPVVATDIRGSREEVVDGETGILVPVDAPDKLAAALNRLVGDGELRRRMGEAGLARARALYDENKIVARQIARLGLQRAGNET